MFVSVSLGSPEYEERVLVQSVQHPFDVRLITKPVRIQTATDLQQSSTTSITGL